MIIFINLTLTWPLLVPPTKNPVCIRLSATPIFGTTNPALLSARQILVRNEHDRALTSMNPVDALLQHMSIRFPVDSAHMIETHHLERVGPLRLLRRELQDGL